MLFLETSSFRVVRSADLAKKSPNLVVCDGAFVTVWPRDVVAFQKAVSTGKIPVYTRAHMYEKDGETIARADLVFAGGGDDRLVGENDAGEPKLQAE